MAPKEGMTTTVTVSLVFMLILQGAAAASRVIDVIVPPHPERKTDVTLECKYDTGAKGVLYALKWYHNDEEIYRYMPKETPPTVIFNDSSVEIVPHESSPEKLKLKEVDLSAAGSYKCELNMDWPEFKQDFKVGNMTVVVIPQEQPNIEGDVGGHYSVGNWVNLNCTAAPSIPPAALVWLINDREAPEEYLRHHEIRKLDDGLMVSNLGLSFKLSKTDFIAGELKLKCTATIATLYHSSDEHSQQDPTAAVNEIRERPSEGSLVTTTGSTGHSAIWASQRILGLPLVALLLGVNLLW